MTTARTTRNAGRSDAALTALRAFATTPYGEAWSPKMRRENQRDLQKQNVADLLCDLAHLCDAKGFDFSDLLRRAESHYTPETTGAKHRQTFSATGFLDTAAQLAVLSERFPWLGTDEEAEGSDAVDDLTEWFLEVGGQIEDGDQDASLDATA